MIRSSHLSSKIVSTALAGALVASMTPFVSAASHSERAHAAERESVVSTSATAGTLWAEGVTQSSGWVDPTQPVNDCWANTTASYLWWWQNQLVKKGYTLPDGTPTDIYDVYKAVRDACPYTDNSGGYVNKAMRWYLQKYFPNLANQTQVPTGQSEYSQYWIGKYSAEVQSAWIREQLEAGRGIAVAITQSHDSPQTGHTWMIWGATFNSDGLVTKLYYTDSAWTGKANKLQQAQVIKYECYNKEKCKQDASNPEHTALKFGELDTDYSGVSYSIQYYFYMADVLTFDLRDAEGNQLDTNFNPIKNTAPEVTQPESTTPEVTQPETTTPVVTQPDSGSSNTGTVQTPSVSTPEATQPEVSTPDTGSTQTPDVITPEAPQTPEVTNPDTVVTPDTSSPEVGQPDANQPEATTPSTTVTTPSGSDPVKDQVSNQTPGQGTGTNSQVAGSQTGGSSSTDEGEAVQSFTVSFNSNGGTGNLANLTATKDQSVKISTTKPTRSGYTFVAWNTQKDGKGTAYNPGASIKVSQDTTLYAQWKVAYKVVAVPKATNRTYNGKAQVGVAEAAGYTVTNGKATKAGTYTAVVTPRAGYAWNASGDRSARKITWTIKERAATVSYQCHVQKIGWQKAVTNGLRGGTWGKSLRVEAFKVKLVNQPYSGGIQVKAHVQKIGWQGWKSNGKIAGTIGKSLRVEALQIRLTGEMAKHYDVYYKVGVQKKGETGWAKNGQSCGSSGYGYRMESVYIKLVPKGDPAPGSTSNTFYKKK
jgi:uncharacterized repeat protein (TIGR02543 family)